MTLLIRELIDDAGLVAITYRQELEPVEGWGATIHPPTYASPRGKRGESERRSEYVINDRGDGTRFCELDTVPSQANRMEASYGGALADLIPRHAVEAGGHRVDLTALPHRLADASIRATALAVDIRGCFESIAAADAVPLARLGPTSLVHGVWDSRDTRGVDSAGHRVADRGARCRQVHPLGAVFGGIRSGGAQPHRRGMDEGGDGGIRAGAPRAGAPVGSWCGAGSTSRRRSCSTC